MEIGPAPAANGEPATALSEPFAESMSSAETVPLP